MKRLIVLSIVALSLAAIPLSHAQSGDMKEMMGMEKGMEMKDIEMKDMETRDMDRNKCMDMMGTDKKGNAAHKKSESKSH